MVDCVSFYGGGCKPEAFGNVVSTSTDPTVIFGALLPSGVVNDVVALIYL